MQLGDTEIRTAFKEKFNKYKDVPLLEEVELIKGKSRVDLIHFGKFITGFEIKSDKDTLKRLSTQTDTYNKSLEKIVLICGSVHTKDVLNTIPSWWGVTEAKTVKNRINFREVRQARVSPLFHHTFLLELLWKSELESILKSYGFTKLNSKTKYQLKNLIKDVAPYAELKKSIIDSLNFREYPTLDAKQK